MRILLISDHADPLAEIGSKEAGGQNIYVFYLAKFLCRLGILVDVYTRWDRKNKKEIVKFNNHLRVIRVKAGPKRYIPRDNFLGVVDEFTENILKRVKKEKINYDIIHTNYWFSGLIGLKVAKKIKKPLVHIYHSIGQVRFESLKKYKFQETNNAFFEQRTIFEKEIAQKADKIITTSPVEKEIIKNLFRISGEKIQTITIGVDTKIFRPIKTERARKLAKVETNGKIILYVGRIEWRKGIGTLLYAFKEVIKKYPNARLFVIGGGKSKSARKLEEAECERLKKISQELGIEKRVKFLGPKKQKELYKYYSAADVCVVSSYYEPFGIVPLESMACGTPVIASRTGGLRYTVKDKITGCLFEPKNYSDLAEKINIVLKNGKDFYTGNCLKRINDDFQWEEIADQYDNFFNQLINKTKK
ncbi:MAG TPA: glycosyltransferase [Candidatus Moranbacteria bacterium]|nr:glycosyltransferase [Candidatus Moranbacteria bacterium]HRZ33920.1 glycosyltransferase [Candidatus Moranbacteria bacterium]HRZ95889.1 glycosyltransferase [Candidatus Moranbacteria bacterium]